MLQAVLVTGRKGAPFTFRRTFERRDGGWVVQDEVRFAGWRRWLWAAFSLLRLAMRFAPAGIVAMSFLLWGGHLFQFWLFARALGPAIPLLDNMAFATLSILAGLVPLTAAGMGTRDAAIVGLYGPFLGQAAGGGSGGSCHLALSHTGTGRAAVPARLLAP